MDSPLNIGAGVVDYALVVAYFAVVLLVGLAARRRVSDSLDFSGRTLHPPRSVTENPAPSPSSSITAK
ncbi:hypothetical protein ACTWPT_45460 [Nonomuraea sp. 3N208]|uniref:hypothetical protein n=1 Tax=Nonomuraea sp. 3N208 TaxID=3457421 RepID=UPI003FD57182